MANQFYSLKALKAMVENLIEQHGEDAPCSAWIYTSEDVVKYGDNGDEVQQTDEICETVLINLQDCDFIYQVIQETVDEFVEEQLMLQQQEMV